VDPPPRQAYGRGMEIRCLGPLEASDGQQPIRLGGPRQRLVLAHLLVRANQTVPADHLIDEVWGSEPPPAARSSLQSYVSHLRRALGPERIEGHGRGYVLRLAPDELDVTRAATLAADGRRLMDHDPAAAAVAFEDALTMWRGPPFADLSGEPSLRPEIARLEELRRSIVDDRITAELAQGRGADLVGELEALTAADPLRERTWAALMLALYRGGRQAGALAAYDRARRVLVDELGIEPSAALQQLHAQVLRHDPALLDGAPNGRSEDQPVPPSAVGVRNPYKGLRAFSETDAPDFFGREALTARLVTRLRDDGPHGRFLAVVGPSGSGKSSVVRAGLVPALRAGALHGSDGWTISEVTPGDDPFRPLGTHPFEPDGDGALLVVIDQFEELFTLVEDEDVRQRYLAALTDAVTDGDGRVRVVITLRADLYDRPLGYPGFAELIRARTEAVVPLTAEELERAVRAPAERVGVAVEPALVTRIVSEVTGQPGALPLLQYALTELFDRRGPDGLTVAGTRTSVASPVRWPGVRRRYTPASPTRPRRPDASCSCG
jgi:DNA-binding SARP family transcriptional activator